MNNNSPDYFTYKKKVVPLRQNYTPKPISKFNFLLQLFIATFIIIFIIVVISIMKYSSKMDVEYIKGDLATRGIKQSENTVETYDDSEQKKIDKRLTLIQQEENLPSEAKIITKEAAPEIIDRSFIEKNKKIEKAQTTKKEQENQETGKLNNIIEEIKNHTKKPEPMNINVSKNVTIMSKILVGHYQTFEDAQAAQNEFKTKDSSLKPFIRKIGEAYSLQMGSYQDFSIAKKQAQALKTKGYDVWIYQQ